MDMGGGHDMDMSGMDMGGPVGHACKIAMTWNWYTVDACFISKQCHIRSKGAFAATVICVFIITALLEAVRRAGRDYDRRLLAHALTQGLLSSPSSKGSDYNVNTPRKSRVQATMVQHLIRVTFFGVQFATAYILMLLAMYYNGYIIGAIILGGIVGFAVFARDTLGEVEYEGGASCC